jgi:catecholate siderophore receptor
VKTAKSKTVLSLRTPGYGKKALAMAIPGVLLAQPVLTQAAEDTFVLDTLQIEERTADTNPYAEEGAPYKAKISGDKRHVKELAETPQTISVLTQTQIQESGKMDLREILAAQPGISLGTGENGNAFGDRYVIRGHEARSDVFVDGLRDPGMTIRESFAVEQIEVTKGPSSTFAGRGSTGGAINSITKQASTEYDFTKTQVGLGTDNHQRHTLDSNQRINDDVAVRANLMWSDEDVPDRDPAARERTGIALSGAWQATDKLSLVADFYYLDAEDKPDLGTYIDRDTGSPVKGIPVYLQDEDFLESEVDVFTFTAAYTFSDNIRLENKSRYGETDNGYVLTGTRGGTRDDSDPNAPGAATLTLSTHQGWQEVEYFVNQTNLYVDTELAGMSHTFVVSGEYSNLNVLNGVFNVENAGATNCILPPGRRNPDPSPGHCATDAGGNPVANLNNLLGRQITRGDQDSDYNVETVSLAVMDTVDFNDHVSAFLGLRVDDFDYQNLVGRPGDISDYSYSDTLWNGHAGLVYKITDDGNVYLTYSSSSNINGGESDVGGSCGYGGLCGDSLTQIRDSKPEQTENIELGTKWEFMEEKLLATAAIFRITKDDVMESVGDDYAALGTLNTGKNRVEGVEVSLVGNLTDKLSISFAAALMESEILDSISEDSIGGILANFADDSAYLQLRYQATPKFAFGGIATYSSEVYTGQPDSAANEELGVPDYTVYDLFASYEVTEQLNLRLTVSNVTNEDYYFAAYRSGSFTYLGDARNAQLTVNYAF